MRPDEIGFLAYMGFALVFFGFSLVRKSDADIPLVFHACAAVWWPATLLISFGAYLAGRLNEKEQD
jgi:hypothetical protein